MVDRHPPRRLAGRREGQMCDDNPTIGQATASPVDWSWRLQAACRSADPAVFYGPEGERPTRKRARAGRRPGDREYQPTLTR